MGARIAAACPAQIEAIAEQGGERRRWTIGGVSFEVAGEIVEHSEPSSWIDGGKILDGHPEGGLGDIGGRIGGGGEQPAPGVVGHGRV